MARLTDADRATLEFEAKCLGFHATPDDTDEELRLVIKSRGRS